MLYEQKAHGFQPWEYVMVVSKMKTKDENEEIKNLHNFSGIVEVSDGTFEVSCVGIIYFNNGRIFNEDGPTFINFSENIKEWTSLVGIPHREDGPAIIYGASGKEVWFLHGTSFESKNDFDEALMALKAKRLEK
jgi:hypothetical protein